MAQVGFARHTKELELLGHTPFQHVPHRQWEEIHLLPSLLLTPDIYSLVSAAKIKKGQFSTLTF